MQVNPIEEYYVGDNDCSCGSCCSARVYTLVEDMESGAIALHDLVALFLCDAWGRGQDHGEPSLY